MRIRSMTIVAMLAAGTWTPGCTPASHIDKVATTSSDATSDAVILVAGLT